MNKHNDKRLKGVGGAMGNSQRIHRLSEISAKPFVFSTRHTARQMMGKPRYLALSHTC